MSNAITAAAFCVAASFLPASVSAGQYTCSVAATTSGNWIAPDIRVDWDEASGQVQVQDGILSYYGQSPAKGKIATDNAKRITFSWELREMKDASGQDAPRLLYRLTVMKADKSATVSMTPPGYSNTFHAAGRCK